MKKYISAKDKYALEGARSLADKLNHQLETLVQIVAVITGEELDENNYGHASDFVYTNESVNTYMSRLGIGLNDEQD